MVAVAAALAVSTAKLFAFIIWSATLSASFVTVVEWTYILYLQELNFNSGIA